MKNRDQRLKQEFINNAIYRLDVHTDMIKNSLGQLSDKEIWQKPNEVSNSIANLILHLCGNITQYTISSLLGGNDQRERDKEFSTASGYTKEEIFAKLTEVIDKAKTIIGNMTEENLLKIRKVQGFTYSGLGIILHVVEHYSYHTGQIAFFTKLMKSKRLGFYDGVDLNVKNKK
ncbi:MAG: DUF1572 domain-containing protein [Flavobacteriaceae bacterium]|nr:DUF1572 domain-containing protein [Flavobacteriaceae bacterium]